MTIYRAYEQLTPVYDNVSGTSKKILSQSGHQIFDVFSRIVSGKVSMSVKCIYIVFQSQCPQLFIIPQASLHRKEKESPTESLIY